MNVYTCTDFNGAWPVGVAAVVVAESQEVAADRLAFKLAERGMSQTVEPQQMIPVNTESPRVLVLCDGNY